MADAGAPRNAAEWAARIQDVLDVGQPFAAFDLSRDAHAVAPDDLHLTLLMALALMRCGALVEGRALVARHEDRLGLNARGGAGEAAPGGALGVEFPDASRVETLAPLATEIYVLSWLRLGRRDDLARARRLQLAIHRQTGDRIALLSAAVLSGHLGDAKGAAALAREALSDDGRELLRARSDHRGFATVALGALLIDARDLAHDAMARAVAAAGHRYMQIAESRAELVRLEGRGVIVDEGMLALVAPPTLVVFTGQHLAATDAAAEQRLAAEIGARLDQLDARIGYASAAAGPDLLFVEAMLARGAEVNLLLPFATDDFTALCVRPAGERWERRFAAALRDATTVTRVSEGPHLGDDIVFRYANQVMDGTARLRARALATEPYLLAAWDYLAMSDAGGPSDFIDHWGDPARLQIIDLDEIVGPSTGGPIVVTRRPPPPQAAQSLAAMMFADIVNFSRLSDLEQTHLWAFMAEVQNRLASRQSRYRLIDSWGDGLLVVMDTALGLADYAMALNECVALVDIRPFDLPCRPQLRIGLHAGPVLEREHPLTGRRMIYGSNVNRAARIEPISVPGKIYASQQFVALLTAEESEHRHEAALRGLGYAERYLVEYVGVQDLPKDFGEQAIYVVHRPEPPDTAEDEASAQVAGLG